MKLWRPLRKPPRAHGSTPGALTPQTWNILCDCIDEIDRRLHALFPSSSPDVKFRVSRTGVTAWLARRARDRSSTTLDPWQPSFFTEGSGESITYKVRFHLGTLNGVPATNWNDAHTLSMGEDEYHFVVLTVTTSSGKVTGLTISVDSTAPSEDSLAKNTPPTTFKVILHAIGRTEAKTILRHNLTANAAEVFREGKEAPAVGAEPFERWWRWNLSTV